MDGKRCFDVVASICALTVFGPFLTVMMLAIYVHDRHTPIYSATRMGKGGRPFVMYKIRSMVINAEELGGSSTASNDPRITRLGRYVRKCKLDELSQFWNVLKGDMSLVGPRPNTVADANLYTQVERGLLVLRPGITDFASIVFSDEGEILKDKQDPDLAYNQIIRPRKNLLGLFYVGHYSVWLDIRLCWLTAITVFSQSRALEGIQELLRSLDAPSDLIEFAGRATPLEPLPLPGLNGIASSTE